ncbi:hypothetical protein [Campylobacter helveticus]|uniref:hypothetical protein n=1 Tax=Campylobacter helveticus TaxID=28898 RepID=UPI002149ACDA|nr:hypothetical protein [Campylobacter helveticus]MCR2062501.1 hypothetical protein [Campylobacter helveticus]MCR2066874.1 hypothetical protein [Campylobacter helveticus]
MNANLQNLEQRFNNLALNQNASLRQKTLEKLSSEAKSLFKEIEKLNKRYSFLEEKLENILNNIENIDDYLALKSNQNKAKKQDFSNTLKEEENNAI